MGRAIFSFDSGKPGLDDDALVEKMEVEKMETTMALKRDKRDRKMTIAQMSAREMSAVISPSKDMLTEAFDDLIALGWKPAADPRPDKPAYSYGWWVHPDHPIKRRPVGGSKEFYLGAWDTVKLYVAR